MATVPLGRYLWTRIHQLGVSKVFGVPGDFNLTLLDHIYDVEGLEWIGNTNELNAAYAADGYARVKNGAGCVVTTHGVGELSAVNAVAGSMTEQVKVVHVVGQTSGRMQENRMMIHHSVGFEPDHQVFNKASRDFRVAAAELRSEEGAAEEIDRVLRECFVKSGPVYIFVPIDLVDRSVPSEALQTPLNLEPGFDQTKVDEAAHAILSTLYKSKNPALFIDCLVNRRNASLEARQLVEKLGILVYTSNMGKGIIDEAHPCYVGLYNGVASAPGVESAFETHDVVVTLGNLPSDTNTGGFTRKVAEEKGLYVNTDDVVIFGKRRFGGMSIKAVINSMIKQLDSSLLPKQTRKPTLPTPPLEPDHDSKLITQSWIWTYLAGNFFQPHDVIFGETGTAAFGIPDVTFPENVQWITQTYYGSIGYCTPAALGAEMALVEGTRERGRTLLVTGDGSLMLTVQEIGNMIKQRLAPIILLINNAGYTIERVIHGAHQSYNDIVPFDYSHMLPFFNMPHEEAKKNFHRCETKAELETVLKKASVREPKSVQVVEIVMDKLDVPWRLSTQVGTRGPEAVKEMKKAGFKVREMKKQEAFWY